MYKSVGKADLLSDHFDSKQSRESVDQLVTCHPSPCLITFAFRSSEVKRLLLDLGPYCGTDPLGESEKHRILAFNNDQLMLVKYPLFSKRTADVLAPRLRWCFDGFFVWGVSLLAGDRPMSPQFQKVHRPPLLPITDQFP